MTRRLEYENGEAKAFYAELPQPSRIGTDATGYIQWFERLVAELGHELWVGDPPEIQARAVWRQKTYARDAEHLLDLHGAALDHAHSAPQAASAELNEAVSHACTRDVSRRGRRLPTSSPRHELPGRGAVGRQ